MALTQKSFDAHLKQIIDLGAQAKIALALSGGGDSMALGFLLSRIAKKRNLELHCLTVDHGLRAESKAEAKQVATWAKSFFSGKHKTLTWSGDKPLTRIQEAAREARYALMHDYCRKHKIHYLFLAHQADDQAETFLFRLAKGSGIDGLSVMPQQQDFLDISLIRPCLDYTHEELLGLCRKNKIPWIEDPSNVSDKFARVRIRKSKDVLSREGLTTERILSLARRLERTRKALDQITETTWKNIADLTDTKQTVINLAQFSSQPLEIAIRILQRAIVNTGRKQKYGPSLQKLEEITSRILNDESFNAATLGNCVIRVKRRHNQLLLTAE